MRQLIALRKDESEQSFRDAQRALAAGTGKQKMDQIHEVAAMESAELGLLDERTRAAEFSAELTTGVILVGVPLAVVLMGLLGVLMTTNIAAPLAHITAAAQRIAAGDLSATHR